jgi:hypothetical protein
MVPRRRVWGMMHSFLGRRRNSPWNAAILNTISPNPDFSRLTTHTLPYIAPTMDGPNFTRDMLRVFEMCNQSLPDARPSAWELRRLVERKMERAQNMLGSFEGGVEKRMEVRIGNDEFGPGMGNTGRKRRVAERRTRNLSLSILGIL